MAYLGSFKSGQGGLSNKEARDKAASQSSRQSSSRSQSTKSSSSRTSSSGRPYGAPTDLSKYGTGEISGANKQIRKDGSVVYTYNGRIVKEYNPQGQSVVRVGVSKQDPSRSGQVSQITAPVIQQQRAMEAYDRALDKYSAELSTIDKKRQADRQKQIRTNIITGNAFQNTRAMSIIGTTSIPKLQGPFSDAYKKRLLENLDVSLVRKQRQAEILKAKLKTNAYSSLSPSEIKELDKITMKISRVESARQKVAERQAATVKKIVGKSGIKGDGYLATAARELPAQAFSAFYNLAPALYKTALEIDTFFTLATASPKVLDKQGFRQEAVSNFRKTGKAVVEAYDPRNPSNLFNIILTATAIGSMAKAGVSRASFNKQMKGAKIKNAKATVYGPKTLKVNYVIKGNLKLPATKFLGREMPARTIPFKTTQQITRATFNSRAFRSMGATKYLVSKTTRTLGQGLKFKKVYTNIDKTVRFKGKGTAKPIKGTKKLILEEQVVLKRGLRRLSEKSKQVIGKKKITKLSNKDKATLITKVRKLQQTKEVVRLKFESKYAQIEPVSLAKLTSSVVKNIMRNLKKGGLTKAKLAIAKTNLSSLKLFLKQYAKLNRSLLKSKKAQLGSTKPFKPGTTETGFPKGVGRDFSKVDGLLKRIEQLDKARATKIADRPSVLRGSRATSRADITRSVQYQIKNFNPSLVFKGYKLLARPLLLNSIIPFALGLAAGNSVIIPAALGGAIAPSIPALPAKIAAITQPVSEPVSQAVTSTTPVSSTITQTLVTTLVASPLLSSRFLPFAGGLPIPGMGGSGRIYSVPLRNLLNAQKHQYSADLYSKIYGLRASRSDKSNLLRAGKLFSGLEIRKII